MFLFIACAENAPLETVSVPARIITAGDADVVETPPVTIETLDVEPWRPPTEIVLDCAWLSQQVDGGSTLNCGPTSLVMAAACLDGRMPDANEIVDVITWMDETIDSYGGVGTDNHGSYTTTEEMAQTAQGYYGLPAQDFTRWHNTAAPEDLYEDLASGVPTLIATYVQGENDTDTLYRGTIGHFMLLVGMTPTHIVVHDPGQRDATLGTFHAYTISSFLDAWQNDAGVRLMTAQ